MASTGAFETAFEPEHAARPAKPTKPTKPAKPEREATTAKERGKISDFMAPDTDQTCARSLPVEESSAKSAAPSERRNSQCATLSRQTARPLVAPVLVM